MRERLVDVGGMRLWLREADGADESAPLVLLLHGFPQSGRMWRDWLEPLAAAGLRPVAPDLRGYGKSDKPHGVRHYREKCLVDDMVGLIAALGARRAHVVGHDWGGAVAWMLAARRPDCVDRLVLLNGPHPDVMRQDLVASADQRARSWYIVFFQLPFLPERALGQPGTIERVLRGTSRRPEAFSDEDIAAYAAQAADRETARSMLAYYRAGARYPGEPLPLVAAPTLVLWGEDDTALGPGQLEGLAAQASDLRIERLAGTSHWIVDEQGPRARERVLGFLAGR